MSQIRCVIQKQVWSDAVEIAFLQEKDGKQYIAKPVILEFVELPEYELPEVPTLRLGHLWADSFLKAIAEALDEAGIKTNSDAKIAGTLEATRGWLEDMRKLVFKSSVTTPERSDPQDVSPRTPNEGEKR